MSILLILAKISFCVISASFCAEQPILRRSRSDSIPIPTKKDFRKTKSQMVGQEAEKSKESLFERISALYDMPETTDADLMKRLSDDSARNSTNIAFGREILHKRARDALVDKGLLSRMPIGKEQKIFALLLCMKIGYMQAEILEFFREILEGKKSLRAPNSLTKGQMNILESNLRFAYELDPHVDWAVSSIAEAIVSFIPDDKLNLLWATVQGRLLIMPDSRAHDIGDDSGFFSTPEPYGATITRSSGGSGDVAFDMFTPPPSPRVQPGRSIAPIPKWKAIQDQIGPRNRSTNYDNITGA